MISTAFPVGLIKPTLSSGIQSRPATQQQTLIQPLKADHVQFGNSNDPKIERARQILEMVAENIAGQGDWIDANTMSGQESFDLQGQRADGSLVRFLEIPTGNPDEPKVTMQIKQPGGTPSEAVELSNGPEFNALQLLMQTMTITMFQLMMRDDEIPPSPGEIADMQTQLTEMTAYYTAQLAEQRAALG